MSAAVVLVDPKYPHNVGQALRACAILGARELLWTGTRVPPPDEWPEGTRLPREERLKLYRRVNLRHAEAPALFSFLSTRIMTPIAVEKRDAAERLPEFQHPVNPVYIFGPEDGSIPRGLLGVCHRFLRIPSTHGMEDVPVSLAGAVYITLYARLAQAITVPVPA